MKALAWAVCRVFPLGGGDTRRVRRSAGLRAPVVFDRACPETFRRRLQASAPTLDCVYFGDGQWIIVVYRGPSPRVAEGRKLHWNAATTGIRDLSVYQQAALMREGWAGLYQFAAVEPCETHAVEALRRLAASTRAAERALEVAVRESQGASRKALLQAERLDFIHTEARSIHRHSSRRPVSIIRPAGLLQ